MSEHTLKSARVQVSPQYASTLGDALYLFLRPLLVQLHRQVDRRLVQTCLTAVSALLMHRHRNLGLVLSELGSFIASPAQAPAGTKRLSRLLHSPRWTAALIEDFLWTGAHARVEELVQAQNTPLVIWDESVLEKSESLKLEGLGPVRSTKAVRLRRIKPGYFNPPGGRPVMVPGWHWLAVLVLGRQGPPTLATLRVWTTRGDHTQAQREVERQVLSQVWQRWGRQVLHVWDRGFASYPWLRAAFVYQTRFIVRWPKRQHLRGLHGQVQPAWQLTRGKRSWDHRLLWDARRRTWRQVGVIAVPVYELATDRKLWLVVARPGPGREPWYLVTTEEVDSVAAAWRIVLAYARRWQVEMAIRFDKCELGWESLRVRDWEVQHKLLGLAALAYAFLLSLLTGLFEPVREFLLTCWCARTGKRSRLATAPLYRLRSALSRLWLAHPPPALLGLSSG
jgi:hypothetical protein